MSYIANKLIVSIVIQRTWFEMNAIISDAIEMAPLIDDIFWITVELSTTILHGDSVKLGTVCMLKKDVIHI